MKIADSSITMFARQSKDVQSQKSIDFQQWVGKKGNNTANPSADEQPAYKLELSASLSDPQTGMGVNYVAATDQKDLLDELPDPIKQKLVLLQMMLEKMTGKRFKFVLPDLRPIYRPSIESMMIQQTASSTPLQAQNSGSGIKLDISEFYSEQQSMSFHSQGQVVTADGKSISFTVELNMSHSFTSQSELHFRAGDAAIDPLVINFDGNAPMLSQTKFAFDLDNNGTKDQISTLLSGSGYLALDKNQDNIINNGSELFGPSTGNGFAELTQYDSDGNNWIDENDAIYDKLRIWSQDEQGNSTLIALGQKGIGALYLGNIASAFDMKDEQNNALGVIRSTGFFLRENGTAGTMQHIDLVI